MAAGGFLWRPWIALAAYAYVFAHKAIAFVLKAGEFDEVSALLSMLGLIDSDWLQDLW